VDSENYTFLFLLGLLTNLNDGKPDNFIVKLHSSKQYARRKEGKRKEEGEDRGRRESIEKGRRKKRRMKVKKVGRVARGEKKEEGE
jgi:hypothetical protein